MHITGQGGGQLGGGDALGVLGHQRDHPTGQRVGAVVLGGGARLGQHPPHQVVAVGLGEGLELAVSEVAAHRFQVHFV